MSHNCMCLPLMFTIDVYNWCVLLTSVFTNKTPHIGSIYIQHLNHHSVHQLSRGMNTKNFSNNRAAPDDVYAG